MRPVFALIPVLVLTSCHERRESSEKIATPVRLGAVEMYTPGGGQHYSASVLPNRQVNLAFKVSGLVSALYQVQGADGRMRSVDLGDRVRQGTTLAQVRRQDFEFQVSQVQGQVQQAKQTEQAASAQLEQAQASALKAEQDFDRADALYKKSSLTKTDYDAAKANRDATRAQVEGARSQEKASAGALKASEAMLGTANLGLGDSALAAPFDGVIVQRSVELGTLVGPGAPAFVLADISSVKATFAVSDTTVAGLKRGTRLSVYAEAFPGQQFRGFISAIAAAADSNTRSFQVEVTIPNDRRELQPGMITALDPGRSSGSKPVLVMPLNSVIPGSNGTDKFAVMAVVGGVARRLPVTLGATYGDRIAVSGVSAGEKVISSGASFVNDGDAVTVIP